MTDHTLARLSRSELSERLRSGSLCLGIPPFVARIRSPIPVVAQGIATLYSDYVVLPESDSFADFHVSVTYTGHPFNRTCEFQIDGLAPFSPLAAGEAFAFLEWGLNWCVTTHLHKWLAIHSAVLERDGHALILPAPPGSGKSTLCAALTLAGWRLLSDEMALLDPLTGVITPAPRPVSLKNESIDIIRRRTPGVVLGPIAHDTLKGNVAHMQVPLTSLQRAGETSTPAWVVFPKYVAGAPAVLSPRGKAQSFMQLAENSFNHNVHGRRGFEALGALIDRSDCFDFSYSVIDEALDIFSKLTPPA